MTRDENASALIDAILVREGGIADIGDGKGLTRFGQTPDWLRDHDFEPPKTRDEAKQNYLTFLARRGLIGLCDYADALADFTIDFAIHTHHRTAIRALQVALGGIAADGIWGDETAAALANADRPRVAIRVYGAELRHQGRAITKDPAQYARWAAGWAARNADKLESLI